MGFWRGFIFIHMWERKRKRYIFYMDIHPRRVPLLYTVPHRRRCHRVSSLGRLEQCCSPMVCLPALLWRFFMAGTTSHIWRSEDSQTTSGVVLTFRLVSDKASCLVSSRIDLLGCELPWVLVPTSHTLVRVLCGFWRLKLRSSCLSPAGPSPLPSHTLVGRINIFLFREQSDNQFRITLVAISYCPGWLWTPLRVTLIILPLSPKHKGYITMPAYIKNSIRFRDGKKYPLHICSLRSSHNARIRRELITRSGKKNLKADDNFLHLNAGYKDSLLKLICLCAIYFSVTCSAQTWK